MKKKLIIFAASAILVNQSILVSAQTDEILEKHPIITVSEELKEKYEDLLSLENQLEKLKNETSKVANIPDVQNSLTKELQELTEKETLLQQELEGLKEAVASKLSEIESAQKAKEERRKAETSPSTSTAQIQQPTISESSTPAGSVRLANGNTAGTIGVQAAQRMEAETGVPASTWELIIARESNGNPNAYNPSGASGLFQTMPGWGDTSTVEAQIQAALRAYYAQGLSAWGM